jgi:hypothetical protein
VLASGAYTVVSLNRWEWNRALFFAVVLLVAEVGLSTALVLTRLARLERSNRELLDPMLREVLRANRPARRDRFAWLKETPNRTGVFVTFMVGGGVLLSLVGWALDRVARVTSTPVGEQRLARDLRHISYPRGGLVVDDVTVLAQEVPGTDDVEIRKLLGWVAHR